MSDVVRVFSINDAPVRRRRRGAIRRALLLVSAVLAMYLLVSSCDRRSYSQFIPKGQKYSVVVTDFLGNRDTLAQSAVWRALPPTWGADAVPKLLTSGTGLPAWVLNNLVGGICYVTGNDVTTFHDAVLITRMTSIGKQLELLHVFASSIEGDHAGGLDLRHVRGTDLYYAVRGRLFLLSPSREALIRVLSLRPEDTAADDPLLAKAGKAGTEHLRGIVTLAPDDPLGKYVQSFRFALRIDATEAHLRCRVTLNKGFENTLGPVLDGLTPQTLATPLSGPIALSANLGKPIKDVWTGLGAALPYPILSAEQWDKWEAVPPGGQPGLPQMLTKLLGAAGPGFTLSVTGVDQNEIVPLPILAGVFDAPSDAIQQAAASWPPVPDTAKPWDSIPRYETDKAWIRLPLPAGPSLEPVAASVGDKRLMFSSSKIVAEGLIAQPSSATSLPSTGNLYLTVSPLDCAQAVADAGQQLADCNLLKGYTPDTFRAKAAQWVEQAKSVRSLSFLVARETGEIAAQADLICAASQ